MFLFKVKKQHKNTHKPEFLENCRSTENVFGHVLGCGTGVFGESGSVNQCGTKGKVFGCKLNLNHRQKTALVS